MSEKTHAYGVAIFEVILSVFQLIIGALMFTFYIPWLNMVSEMSTIPYYPSYMLGMFTAAGNIILFLSIFVLVHAVRRIVDKGLAAYAASKKEGGTAAFMPQGVLHCMYCGTEISEDAKFCEKCGKKLS